MGQGSHNFYMCVHYYYCVLGNFTGSGLDKSTKPIYNSLTMAKRLQKSVARGVELLYKILSD